MKYIIIIMMILFLFSCEKMPVEEKYIQGEWEISGTLSKGFSWYKIYSFDRKKFKLKGYPEINITGKYSIEKIIDDKIFIKLFDLSENRTDEHISIKLLQKENKLYINDEGPYLKKIDLSEIKIKLTDDYEIMKKELYDAIPRGTSILNAEKILKNNGFKCTYQYKSDFVESFKKIKKDYRNIDYLYCDKTEGIFVASRWQIALLNSEQKVYEILISYGLIGP